MKLKDILRNIDPVEVTGSLDTEITAITCDSREVVPGALFIAVKGFASDGHKYIPSALEKGAVAVIFEGALPPIIPRGSRPISPSDTASAGPSDDGLDKKTPAIPGMTGARFQGSVQ